MALRITCPSCQASYNVGDDARGKRIACRECGEPMRIPGSSPGADDRFRERRPSGGPVRAGAPPRWRDDRYEDDEEDAGKKKGMGLPILAGALLCVAAAGITLFFVLTSGGSPEKKPNNPGPVAQNPAPQPPVNPLVNPGPQPNPGNPAPNNPTPANPENKTPPANPAPNPADPPKDPGRKEAPEPEVVPVAALGGEKVYQRALRSTVWILAPQKRGGGPLAGNPGVPPPAGNPFAPGQGQGLDLLAGTEWSGNETLAGFGPLRFVFKTADAVDMHDAQGLTPGSYNRNAQRVMLTFPGNVTYNGEINGDTMSGTATNGQKNWTWSVTRQAAGTTPKAPFPGIGGPNRPGGKGGTSTGTGSLVDRKHRLVITNCHVVGSPESVTVYFPEHDASGQLVVQRDHYKNKAGIPGRVVLQEERCDLALVQLDRLPDGARVLPLARGGPQPGQQVHSVGNPGASGGLWIYSPGKVRQVLNDKWQVYDDLENRVVRYDARKIETDSPINPGDSGGPLVNDRAAMVGVAHAGNMAARSMSIFIDVSEVRGLLERFYKSKGEKWEPEPEPAAPTDVAQLPDWIKKLTDKDFGERLKAARALGGMGEEARLAFGPLFEALKDENAVVRRAAADALEKVPPHKDDAAMLGQTVKDAGESVEVRLHAGKALARLGPEAKSALPALLDSLKEKDESLRRQAMTAIAAVGPEAKDVPVLAKALKDPNLGIRKAAADALASLGGDAKAALPELLAQLKKGDKDARLQSLRVLQAVGGSKEATAALIVALKDADAEVSAAAAKALLKAGEDKVALNHYLGGLKAKDSAQRKAAATALAALGADARPALAELVKAVDDEQTRGPALDALVKIGQDAAQPMVEKMLKAKSAAVRLALIEALPRIRYDSADIRQAVLNNLVNVVRHDPAPSNRQAALTAAKRLQSGLPGGP